METAASDTNKRPAEREENPSNKRPRPDEQTTLQPSQAKVLPPPSQKAQQADNQEANGQTEKAPAEKPQAQPRVKPQSQPETQPQAKLPLKPQEKPQEKPPTSNHQEPSKTVQPPVKPPASAQPPAQVQPKPQAQPQVKPQTQAQPKPPAHSQEQIQPKLQGVQPQAKAGSEPVSEPEAKPEETPEDDEDDIEPEYELSCELINDPLATIGGREYHDCVKISSTDPDNSEFLLKKGDAVFMTSEDETLVCKVNGFFVRISEDNEEVFIEGRWFLSRQDLMGKLGKTITPDVIEFFDLLKDDELVLTHLMEENNITCIQKPCDVYYVKPDEAVPEGLPKGARVCRYKLDIDTQAKTIEWQDYEEDDEETVVTEPQEDLQTMEDDAANTDTRTVDTLSSESEDEQEEEEEDEDSESSSSGAPIIKAPPIQEGEGTVLRGDIQVGPKYQMKVGKFVPGQTVHWRGAKLVHKKGGIDDDKLHEFLEKVAKAHREYVKQHGMLLLEPYTPLSQERAEELMKDLPNDELPTGSTLSTASMLSGKRCNLTKECSPDELLMILADNDYDTEKALEAIKADLEAITVGWTKPERDIFDDGFRRHEGELPPIAKAIAPTKCMKEVVDYHYRFKIPDQFRKYQEKKREQAARMLTCIETRQYHESLLNNNSEHNKSENNWSEKSVASMASEKEERVRTAKSLLMDVKDRLGKATMVHVASVIRELQVSYSQEARNDLFALLKEQPELQKRFLGFLPKHV